jgi:hypothetical protein
MSQKSLCTFCDTMCQMCSVNCEPTKCVKRLVLFCVTCILSSVSPTRQRVAWERTAVYLYIFPPSPSRVCRLFLCSSFFKETWSRVWTPFHISCRNYFQWLRILFFLYPAVWVLLTCESGMIQISEAPNSLASTVVLSNIFYGHSGWLCLTQTNVGQYSVSGKWQHTVELLGMRATGSAHLDDLRHSTLRVWHEVCSIINTLSARENVTFALQISRSHWHNSRHPKAMKVAQSSGQRRQAHIFCVLLTENW